MAAFCAIALACGVSALAVWRHAPLASPQPNASRAARSSELQPPFDKMPTAARRDPTKVAVAPRLPTAVAAPSKSSSATAFDEQALMRLLRRSRGNDPVLAIELARDGNRRFPGSADAPERASILIHALAAEGLASEARGEAEDMVNRYPDSAWVHEIERFTGARRHRDIQVGPGGELRYVDPPLPSRG
jgi:hypothetical protein